MKITRKLTAVCLALTLLATPTISFGQIYHSISDESVVTNGAVHINEKLLTDKGWRNINILKIDLSNPNIKVGAVDSADGQTRETMTELVVQNGAVAGVNADYFDMGTSSSPSLGMLIEDGELSHGYNSNYQTVGINNNMATFMISSTGMPIIDYYGISIRLYSEGNLIGTVDTKNNVPGSIKKPIVIDDSYYKTTNNIISAHPNLYTIVVENNIVTNKTQSNEVVNIPENGYVVLLPESIATEYYSKVDVGKELKLEETLYLKNNTTESVENMKLGVGGSGIIMKNGEKYTGGRHAVSPGSSVARTIVATVKGTNELLLITVDNGSGYIGTNETDLIDLLKRYNVNDAMYFDGGGSTTFVAREEGEAEATLQNNPTGTKERKVVNGVGVFTTSETGGLSKLIVKVATNRTFKDEPIALSVKGVDANGNPVNIEESKIKVNVEGGKGNYVAGNFIPTTAGNLKVKVSYDGITSETISIKVSNEPKALVIDGGVFVTKPGVTKEINNIYGIDDDGYRLPLSVSKINITSPNPNIVGIGNTVSTTANLIDTADFHYTNGNINVTTSFIIKSGDNFTSEDKAKLSGRGNKDYLYDDSYKDKADSAYVVAPDANAFTSVISSKSIGGIKFAMMNLPASGLKDGWNKFKNVINTNTIENNIVIVAKQDPLTVFKDSRESSAFHEYLAALVKAGKNITVVYMGSGNKEVKNKDGIRYIKINNTSGVKFKTEAGKLYYSF